MRFGGFAICALALGCGGQNTGPDNTNVPPAQAPAVQGTAAQPPNFDVFREGITFSSTRPLLEAGITSDHFDFSHLRELYVKVNVADMGGTAPVHLAVITPTGSTFYETTQFYSTDPGMRQMRVPRSPHPIDVYTALKVNGGHSLIYTVPIVGTAVARYPLPGTWRIEATVEGHRTLSAELVANFI
jgi:hypothetical protein